MAKDNLVETLIGAAVLIVAGFFFYFAYKTADIRASSGGYEVSARFDRVDGLAIGSDVRMSGIKVGTVTRQELDRRSYEAVVYMMIDKTIELPDDSSAKITSEGLLGGNYLSLEPGGSEELIANGGEIPYTQGSVDLMGLIGQAVFSATSSSDN